MATPVITITDLTRRFGQVMALDGLSLEVSHGEVFGFLGHNGAGKTTTVRLLNGVLAATSGNIRVLDLDPISDGPALRRRTGVLTENPSLDERLSAVENLRFYADLTGVAEGKVKARIEALLDDFELSERAREKVGGYSKGMKQRLALARALLHEPELIYLDEPTSGLDPVAAHHVRQIITRLSKQEGRTVFVCTHNLDEAQRLCDRVAVLEHGRLLAVGTPTELGQRLGRAYRLEFEIHKDDIGNALKLLNALTGVKAEADGHGTIKVSGAQHDQTPQLIHTLSQKQIRIYRATPEEPSLEDVYFALHGEQETE